MLQILTALLVPHRRTLHAGYEVYSTTRARFGIVLPELHELEWGERVAGETLVCKGEFDPPGYAESERRLSAGEVLQVFCFNGDSECVRHYLLVPLPEPAPWLREW